MKYKKGDRVIRIKSTHEKKVSIGSLGTVCKPIHRDGLIGVSWDDFTRGHNCSNTCPEDKGYFVPCIDIKLAEINWKERLE